MISASLCVTITRNGKTVKVVNEVPPVVEQLRGQLEELEGNGLAQVERNLNVRYSLAYSQVAISSSCAVRLTCNQDIETIDRAKRAASYIVHESVVGEDAPYLQEFLEHYREHR